MLKLDVKILAKNSMKMSREIKEGCNRGHGLSAAIKLGTPEPGFFHFGPRLTWFPKAEP